MGMDLNLMVKILLCIPRLTILAGYYGLALVVHVPVRPPVVCRMFVLISIPERKLRVNCCDHPLSIVVHRKSVARRQQLVCYMETEFQINFGFC